MYKRTFGKRSLAFVAAIGLILSVAATVFADAANPNDGVTVGGSGLHVTLSGTWTWFGRACDAEGLLTGGRDVGFAVDWDEGFDGNDVSEADPTFHPGGDADNLVYQRGADIGTCSNPNSADAQGAWGPISHDYAKAGSYTPCAIMYDVHEDSETPNLVAGGPKHNKDNSIEKNSFEGGANCADVEIVIKTPEGSVAAGTGQPNTALSQSGVTPIPTIVFSLILLASLGTLAYANVKTVRNRS
jgi:hypothetical protein